MLPYKTHADPLIPSLSLLPSLILQKKKKTLPLLDILFAKYGRKCTILNGFIFMKPLYGGGRVR